MCFLWAHKRDKCIHHLMELFVWVRGRTRWHNLGWSLCTCGMCVLHNLFVYKRNTSGITCTQTAKQCSLNISSCRIRKDLLNILNIDIYSWSLFLHPNLIYPHIGFNIFCGLLCLFIFQLKHNYLLSYLSPYVCICWPIYGFKAWRSNLKPLWWY